MVVFRCGAVGALIICSFAFETGCGGSGAENREPVRGSILRAPTYDQQFRDVWNDGSEEISTYKTERQRGGAARQGDATVIMKRVIFDEDERVAVSPKNLSKSADRELFPAMEMNWIERYSVDGDDCSEMTTSAVTLTSEDGRPTGTATKDDFSMQSQDGQLFHQLLFDSSGVRSHQYSFVPSEGDEQITLSYPRDGVSGDALWFWARQIAAPLLKPGEQVTVQLLPALSYARPRHVGLDWKRAALERGAAPSQYKGHAVDTFQVTTEGGRTQKYLVEAESPHRILHWEDSLGQHAEYEASKRVPVPER